MGSPYVEAEEDQFDITTDWYEQIADQGPLDVIMSNDIQEVTRVGFVRYNKMRSCIRWFLGFAYCDNNSPWRLYRENPQWDAEFPQLRAYEVRMKPWVPLANEENENSSPYYRTPFTFEGDKAALYKWLEVTVRYRNFMYRFKEDSVIADPEDEWRRNCFIETEPRVEALTITGGQSQLTFAESSDTGPPISPNITPFPAPVAQLQSKKGITLNWYGIPWDYLSEDEDIFSPTKLDAIVGKVNSDTFLGRYEPGTLLAEPYSWKPSTYPVVPEDKNDPLRLVDVGMRFVFFDPERGADKPAGAPFARGHNLMPWGGTGKEGSPGGDGKYYLATRDGTTTGTRLIQSAAFAPVFTHVQS